MSTLIQYVEIILGVLLVLLILIQQATGSGGALGSSDNFSSVFHTRRGFEKITFNATIVVAVLFVLSSVLTLIF